MNYIDDNIQNGILIDWKSVIKEYNKLDIPNDVYTPINLPFNDAKYFIECSERSIGKTTNWLLLGMILNKKYGITIEYIRQTIDMIMPRHLKLFNTIIEHGYIEKITDGKYNNVKYFSRKFYYINTETGEECANEFMNCLSIDNNMDYKSSYNSPRGDLIIFDEFISKYYRVNEFIDFEDLIKTIIRERKSPIIAMLSNTIDRHNVYFKELEIYDDIQQMRGGERKTVTTEMGTKIHINLISNVKNSKKKSIHNKLFFGFKNELLNSIRGGEWATDSYPHIVSSKNTEIILKNHYINFNDKLINIELVNTENNGLCCFLHMASKTYSDSIIYTHRKELTSYNERYLFGYSKTDKLIWRLYEKNKFYYSDNTVGEIVNSYIKICKQLKNRL